MILGSGILTAGRLIQNYFQKRDEIERCFFIFILDFRRFASIHQLLNLIFGIWRRFKQKI